MFVSPDPVVQDAYDPLCWTAYAYCRNNPVTYTDPSGRSCWGIVLAALAIVALIVITHRVLRHPGALPWHRGDRARHGVGGVVGGLAAAQKGGGTEDIFEGVLVGAAVGGWAAFVSVVGGGAGAGVARAARQSGFWGAVIAGAVNGAISGAAMGFAAGYAGGKGSLDDVLEQDVAGRCRGAARRGGARWPVLRFQATLRRRRGRG